MSQPDLLPAPPSKLPPFVVFSGGHCLSSVGAWMQKTAVGWLAWEMTHSPAWVGAIALSDLITAIWVAPFAGTVTDRNNPYRLIMTTQFLLMLMSLVLFGLTQTELLTIWILFGWAIIDSSLQGFNSPARMVVIGSLATNKQMGQAVATNSLAVNVARSIGPAIAGGVIASSHIANVFLLNGLSYIFMFAVLIYLKKYLNRAGLSTNKGSMLKEISSGFSYIYNSSQIYIIFFLVLCFSLLARPFTELFPAIAGQVLQGDAQTLSWLMTAQGIGALAAAVWFLRAKPIVQVVRITLLGCLGLGGALIIFSISTSLWLVLSMVGLAGFFHAACNIGMQTIAQTLTDPEYKGRVMALYGLLFRAGPALGAFIIGGLAHWFNLQWLLGLAAALFIVLVLKKLPAFRLAFLLRKANYTQSK